MTSSLSAAGFRLEILDEPEPDAIVRELDPDAWTKLTTQPRFISSPRRDDEQLPRGRVPYPEPRLTLGAHLGAVATATHLGELDADIRTFAADHDIELVPTPTYASYLNPAECHFSALTQFVVANADYPN